MNHPPPIKLPPDYETQFKELAEDFNTQAVELADATKELAETQDDLSTIIAENTQLSKVNDALQQRILRLEGILTTGALAFRGLQ